MKTPTRLSTMRTMSGSSPNKTETKEGNEVDIEKLRGESDLDFHRRVVYGKLVDKTLADVDYAELSDLLYGQQYHSDSARRMMYGSLRTLQLVDAEQRSNITDADVLREMDAKREALQKESQRFYDQRREYNKLVAETARNEHLEERLVAAAEKMASSADSVMGFDPVYGRTFSGSPTEAVLVLCDWHYGMTTKNVWNTYDTNICRERVRAVIEAAVARIKTHGCHKLHVVVLGDLVHGAIHTSARVASEELACDQIMNVSEILAQSIEYVSQFVDVTEVHTTYGNHARTVQNKNDSTHRDNMERIIPWWLAERLKSHSNIVIHNEYENEFIFLDVCGYGICASHGDLDGVKGSPRLLTTLFQKRFGKNVDYILLADKHHRESFEELGVSAMICGALCGTDDYANTKRLYATPEQLLLIVDPDAGVDAEYHLKCR